jgi:hypothetical protein
VVDPYTGSCSPGSSWWAAQRPYYDSAVNAVTTATALPDAATCPNPVVTHLKDQFAPGDTIYFITYYRDQLSGQQSQYTIYKPDGSVYQNWTGTMAAAYWSTAYWYRAYTLSANAPTGRWKYQVVYNGQTYQHTFSVGNTMTLRSRPADHALYLGWDVIGTLPVTTTWQLTYAGPLGDQPYLTSGLPSATRAFTLTHLQNYAWYTVTLTELDNALPVITDTLRVMPTNIFVYLPLAIR